MAKNKKSRASAARKGKKGASSWQSKHDNGGIAWIGVVALIGVLAIVGGYFLQNSALLAIKTDESAIQGGSIRISEIMSDNASTLLTETGDVPDWIEITNTGSQAVSIGKYSLLLGSNLNRMFTFPEYTLQPGEYLLIYAEGMNVSGVRGDWSAPFKISPSGGETLVLMNAQSKAIDSVEIPELDTDVSYSRGDDGSWHVGSATPGRDNHSAAGGAEEGMQLVADVVVISEVMSANTLYFPDENGEIHDYVELHNTSGEAVNLEGWYLSDASDKLKKWAFPAVTLPANGYITVHCSGYGRSADPAHLHTGFKIGSDGETIFLSRPDGQTVDRVELPALQADQAYSHIDGAWQTSLAPTPGMDNTTEAAARVHAAAFGDRSGDVHISEVMASALDQPYDWVEIYNGSGQAVDLSDYGLSDSSDKPRKWQFPAGTVIQPGQYMGVYLTGTLQDTVNGYLNADFALNAEGGFTVTLADPQGKVLDAVYLTEQYTGISYGRVSGESGFFLLDQGTPGVANTANRYRSRADMAQCSREGGLFRSGESFSVELIAPAGSRIYYTLDSSDPTESSMLYTGPIQISGTTILRSRVYRDGSMPSLINTQSYLYDVSNDGGLYVISLVSDMKNLQGDTGILTHYMEAWEVEAHFELFTADGTRVLGQGCGISLHGQDSRKAAVKTFNVIARRQYGGTNRFEYPIFEERDYTAYQSFLMRSSGEDYKMSFMRDTVLSSLMQDTSVMYQKYEPAIVYLDGQYYTLTYIRERLNSYAICQFEGWEGMEDAIDLIKGNESVKQGSNASFRELLEWVKSHDLTTQEAYDYIGSHIDIRNYIEYMALQLFTGNTDTLNVKRYRNAQADGKWRWVLFDLDWAFYNDTNSIGNWLTPGGTGAGRRTDNTLFIACMKNPIFREEFLTYFGEQMATTFSTENVLARAQAHYARIEDALIQYKAQWNLTLSGMRKFYSYAETRPRKIIEYFREAMNLSDAEMEKYFGPAMQKVVEYERKAGE